MNLLSIVQDPVYPQLKSYVLAHTGLEYYAGKDDDFAARLNRRLTARGIRDCGHYLPLLRHSDVHPNEMDALVGELTIGETYFFREQEHFELLRSTILPDLLKRNADFRGLNIWSAGCATGAEAYSIAILLRTEFDNQLRDWNVSILGTDINMDFLEQARLGLFSKWALRDIPPHIQSSCFRQDGTRWQLNSEYRGMVEYRYHNLAVDLEPPSSGGTAFDLIVCRNALIYFSTDRIREATKLFFSGLAEDGWLLIGHAEHNPSLFNEFELVPFPDTTAYRKRSGERREQFNPSFMVGAPVNPVVNEWQPDWWMPEIPPAPQIQAPLPGPSPSPATLLNDARHLADRGMLPDAAAICHRVLEGDSLNAGAHLTLGLVLAGMGRAEDAMAALQRAVYTDRGLALAHYHLGTLRQTLGQGEAARRCFRNTIELLRGRGADEPVEFGDGIRVDELSELARVHQESIGK